MGVTFFIDWLNQIKFNYLKIIFGIFLFSHVMCYYIFFTTFLIITIHTKIACQINTNILLGNLVAIADSCIILIYYLTSKYSVINLLSQQTKSLKCTLQTFLFLYTVYLYIYLYICIFVFEMVVIISLTLDATVYGFIFDVYQYYHMKP